MFSTIIGNYNNDEQSQQFLSNSQYSNLIASGKNPQSFSNQYMDPNTLTHVPLPDIHTDNTLAPDYPPPDVKIKNNIILVNSIDRDWYNLSSIETPYNFDVKFGGYGTNAYSVVNNEYRNIISFSIDRIVLSNRVSNQNYSTANTTVRLTNNPYLTVSVRNINYSSYGTNKTLNNTMGMFTPLIPLPITLTDISYLEFKNASVQKKEYFPIPEGIITQLGLQITDPTGNIISNVNDVLSIYSIYNSNTAPVLNTGDYLIVQTNEYFYANEFQINDQIFFKNYVYHNMSFDESGLFCNYINRKEGHTVLGISKSNVSTILYNCIHIPIPANLSSVTGNFDVETWYEDFITKTFPSVPIQDTSGKLINANTQSHFAINIKTLEKNNNNLFLKNLV